MSIKYVTMDVPGVSWSIKGAFEATISNKQIAEIFKSKIKRELNRRGLEESDLPDVNFKMIKEYLEIITIKLGIAKVSEYGFF